MVTKLINIILVMKFFASKNGRAATVKNTANVKLWLKHLTKGLYGCNFVAILS